MEKYLLTKTQRNAVFEAISNEGLPPDSFNWREVKSPGSYGEDGSLVSSLAHLSTQSEFTFDFHDETGHWASFTPGEDKPSEYVCVEHWKIQLAAVRKWLSTVHREADAPDLWATFAGATPLTEMVSSGDVDPFDSHEINALGSALQKINGHFATTLELTEAQTNYLDAKLDYLECTLARLGRTDWLHTAIGVFGTIIVALGIEAARASEVWQFVEQALGPVVHRILQP